MEHKRFKAIYGSFDSDMVPVEVTDVTKIISDNFLKNGKIIIPAKVKFASLFAHSAVGYGIFLQIVTEARTFNILEDGYKLDMTIDIGSSKKQIKVVYYAYIDRKSNWKNIIAGQLMQLRGYGLLDEADLHVHITDTANIFDDVVSCILQIKSDAIITRSSENHFEYHAIRLIYDLAGQNPEAYFIYLHTKGMSYQVQSRVLVEVALTTGTFQNWRKNLEVFHDENINKIGLFPAIEDEKNNPKMDSFGGWIWFNFWYAKGSYLTKCEPPEIQASRYYWEAWLGGYQNEEAISSKDCYNIFKKKDGPYFTAAEACEQLDNLIGMIKFLPVQ